MSRLILAVSFVILIPIVTSVCVSADESPPHNTTVSLISVTSTADHVVETGDGQLFTVVGINPITYGHAYISNVTTTTQAQVPFSLPPGLPVGPIHQLTNPSCSSNDQLTTLRCERDGLVQSFKTRLTNATNVWNHLVKEATDYSNDATKAAVSRNLPPRIADDEADCLREIATFADWLSNGQPKDVEPLAAHKCPDSVLSDKNSPTTLTPDLFEYQVAFGQLTADVRKANPDLDLSKDLPSGTDGQLLAQKEQPLQAFADLYPLVETVSYPVWCHPHNVDTVSNSLTLVAINRFDSTKNLSQAVGVVDCPGALAVSTGGGYSRVPLATFQAVPSVTNGVVTSNVIGYGQNARAQTVAAAFFHYFVLSLGGQAGLFLTGGIGTSSSNLSGFYGASIGLGRRVYLNIAENVANVTVLAPGFSINQAIPNGFQIPTTAHTTTKLSFTISIGGASTGGSAGPPATPKKGP